jgi:hypothetical protein
MLEICPVGQHKSMLLFLILTIITIMLLIMPPNVYNNNIANALKQNNAFRTLFSSNSSSGSSSTITSNINNNKAITITATPPSSISLPLSRGYVDGKIAYFIATDASDNQTALEITNNLKYKVNFAPSLAFIPDSSRQQGYEFLNGIRGQGAFGFQLPIASKLPANKDYSPIVQLNFVKWNSDITGSDNVSNNHTSSTVRELKSVSEMMAAQKNKELTITRTNILINSPAVFAPP